MTLPITEFISLQIINPIDPDSGLPLTNVLGQGGFAVAQMTTTQRNLLTTNNGYSGINPAFGNGTIIYNTTTNEFNFYQNGDWEVLALISTIDVLNAREVTRNKEVDAQLYSLRKRIERLEKVTA